MVALPEKPSSKALAAPAATSRGPGTIAIRTSDLVAGRRLKSPIHDSHGVLLLAAGSVITPRFKQLLKTREVEEIQASHADALELTRPEADDLSACLGNTPDVVLPSELTAKLESLIVDGGLFVKNSGQAVNKRVVLHGCKGYDLRRRNELEQRHQASAQALDGMIRSAISGTRGSATQIAEMASSYLTAMTDDRDLLMSFASATSADASLSQHCLQMSMVGMAIAVEMGLDAQNVQTVGMCGLVHDWGMMKVPEAIRMAPRLLSKAEFLAIQKHPIYALEMLQSVNGIEGIIPLVCYQVHERLDGSGYPRGRMGRQIHLFAKILNVADAYISLTSPRPYRPALMPHAAIECLLALSAEGQADHESVQKLLMAVSLFPIGSLVELSDGSVAQSLRRNGTCYSQPIVRIVRQADGRKADPDDDSFVIDLAASELTVTRALPYPGKNQIPLSTAILEQRRS